MATSDELLRTAAARFDFQVRLYVGGKYSQANLDSISAGGSYTPTVSTTLTAGVDNDDTSLNVASTSGFTTGTVLIIPETDDYEYELLQYGSTTSTTFDDLTRGEFKTGMSGTHKNGSTVSEWVNITEKLLGLDISYDEQQQTAIWQATLRGIEFDSSLLDNDNSILIMWRFRPSAGDFTTWTSWEVAAVGYIKSVELTDDYKRLKSWQAIVEGLSQYVAATDIPAHQFGKTDLAENKTVTVSSELEDPFQEQDSGEYLGSPDLGGGNLVDSDMGTLWISDGEPSSTPDTMATSGLTINEVYLRPPTWYDDADYQWVELAFRAAAGDARLNHFCLVAKCTTWGNITWYDADGNPYVTRVPSDNYIDFSGGGPPKSMRLSDDGSFAIVCSNKAKFLEKWSDCDAAYVIDWRAKEKGTFEIDVTGDFLALHNFGSTRTDVVWFGSISLYEYQGSGYGSGWSGATVAIPPRGHSFRRNPTGTKSTPDTAASFLADEDHPTPGNYVDGDPEWATVDLGLMGIELDQELSSGETGTAYLNATLGLTGSGDVKIDSEIIGYTARNDGDDTLTTLTRGKYSTTPATHPVGSTVEQYEDGAATQAHLITAISWKRRRVLDSNGNPIVPQNFDVYISTASSPNTPDDAAWDNGLGLGGWEDYWELKFSVRDHHEPFWSGNFEPIRARHVLLCVYDMSDAGRVKLNEFHIYAATLDIASGMSGNDTYDGEWSGDVIQYLLEEQFGLGSGLFTMTDNGRQFESLPTTATRAMSVIRDIARRTGCVVHFHLDHTVEHRFDPLYPLGVIEDIEIDWDRDYARQVDLSLPFRHNVSQITLQATDPVTDELFEVRYPPFALDLGAELEIDDLVLGSADEAWLMAEMLFAQHNAPMRTTVIPVGPAEWVRPGQRHTITWSLDEEGTHLEEHNFVVQGVTWSIDFGQVSSKINRPKSWTTTIRLRELLF